MDFTEFDKAEEWFNNSEHGKGRIAGFVPLLMAEYAEYYHQNKVKNLDIPRVSGSAFDIKEVELFHFAIIKALPHTNKKTNGYAAMIKTRYKLAGMIKEHYR